MRTEKLFALKSAEKLTVWLFILFIQNVEMQHDGELKYNKDMALYIKHELEKKVPGGWHIIVGKKTEANDIEIKVNKILKKAMI